MKLSIRDEIAKLKSLTFKGKLEHIWEYYKILLFSIVAVILLAGYIIYGIANPRPDTELFIAWNMEFLMHEQADALSEALTEGIGLDSNTQEVAVSWFPSTSEDPQMMMAGRERLIAMLSAGAIDIIVVDKDFLQAYADGGMIMPLDEVLSEVRSRNPAAYESIMENAVFMAYLDFDENTIENYMGIEITNNPLLLELGFFEIESFLTFAVSIGNKDNAVSALIALFE